MERPQAAVVVGGAGLVGRYMLRRWKERLTKANSHLKLLSLDLRAGAGAADVNLLADLRDPSRIEDILFKEYDVKMMVIAVKPPLVGPSYQSFMEVNMAGLCDLVNLAERYRVGSLVYVSSFAACNHWLPHQNLGETDPAASPPLTSLRSPYDLSKAMAEQFILQKHSETMRTVSVRIGGVYGDDDDQYWNRRLPFRLSLDISDKVANPPKIDANYVENVAEGLVRVAERLAADATVGGRFYFYTIGDRHATQQELGYRMAEATGRFHIAVPVWVVHVWLAVMSFVSSFALQLPSSPFNQPAGRTLEPKPYFSRYSMAKMGLIDQWFDNKLFRTTFGFSHIYTTEEAIARISEAQLSSRSSRNLSPVHSHKRPGLFTLVAGPVLISLCTTVLVFFCGGLSLSVAACSASSSLCSICQVGFFVSSPATHICGLCTQPTYRLWQPFRGGRLHVVFQGIGWTLFSVLVIQKMMDWVDADVSDIMEQLAYLNDHRMKAAFALVAQVTLGLSVLFFKSASWEKKS